MIVIGNIPLVQIATFIQTLTTPHFPLSSRCPPVHLNCKLHPSQATQRLNNNGSTPVDPPSEHASSIYASYMHVKLLP